MVWALKWEQLLVGQDWNEFRNWYDLWNNPSTLILSVPWHNVLYNPPAVLAAIWNVAVSQHCSTLYCHTTKCLNNLPQYLNQHEIIQSVSWKAGGRWCTACLWKLTITSQCRWAPLIHRQNLLHCSTPLPSKVCTVSHNNAPLLNTQEQNWQIICKQVSPLQHS